MVIDAWLLLSIDLIDYLRTFYNCYDHTLYWTNKLNQNLKWNFKNFSQQVMHCDNLQAQKIKNNFEWWMECIKCLVMEV